jgi:hypothetical protein
LRTLKCPSARSVPPSNAKNIRLDSGSKVGFTSHAIYVSWGQLNSKIKELPERAVLGADVARALCPSERVSGAPFSSKFNENGSWKRWV